MNAASPAVAASQRPRRRWLRVLLCCVVAAIAWAAFDLYVPAHASMRDFDPHSVGRLETAMWRSYYDRHPVRLFAELAATLRTQYHFRMVRAWAGALYGARAAVVFQRGHGREEYERALPDLRRFYALIREQSDSPFQVENAARLELEWWIVHRQRAQHPPGDLEAALAALQAEVYQTSADRFREHAKDRAEAMLIRDQRAAAGTLNEDDWRRIGELLDQSWTSLWAAVQQEPEMPVPNAVSSE